MKGWLSKTGMVMALALVASSATWGETVGRTEVALDAREARSKECTLGDLVADAARAALRADVALVQAGQLRADVIPAGEVTREALVSVLFYPDERVVRLDMSGEKLLAALEWGLSALRQPSPGFLQVSGLSVTFRSEAEPQQRVVQVKVGEEELVPAKTYRVALPARLAKGASGYFRIFNGMKTRETGPSLGEAASTYLKARGTISIDLGQRLRDMSPPPAR